jgi:hypothetical protein
MLIVLVILYQDNLPIFDIYVRSFLQQYEAKNLSANFIRTERDILEIDTRCCSMAFSWHTTLSVEEAASPARELCRFSV